MSKRGTRDDTEVHISYGMVPADSASSHASIASSPEGRMISVERQPRPHKCVMRSRQVEDPSAVGKMYLRGLEPGITRAPDHRIELFALLDRISIIDLIACRKVRCDTLQSQSIELGDC